MKKTIAVVVLAALMVLTLVVMGRTGETERLLPPIERLAVIAGRDSTAPKLPTSYTDSTLANLLRAIRKCTPEDQGRCKFTSPDSTWVFTTFRQKPNGLGAVVIRAMPIKTLHAYLIGKTYFYLGRTGADNKAQAKVRVSLLSGEVLLGWED